MKAKRKRHEPEFKGRVALEASKGAKTIQQIAKEYDIHPVQVSDCTVIICCPSPVSTASCLSGSSRVATTTTVRFSP